jgi:hypothetical protein
LLSFPKELEQISMTVFDQSPTVARCGGGTIILVTGELAYPEDHRNTTASSATLLLPFQDVFDGSEQFFQRGAAPAHRHLSHD